MPRGDLTSAGRLDRRLGTVTTARTEQAHPPSPFPPGTSPLISGIFDSVGDRLSRERRARYELFIDAGLPRLNSRLSLRIAPDGPSRPDTMSGNFFLPRRRSGLRLFD